MNPKGKVCLRQGSQAQGYRDGYSGKLVRSPDSEEYRRGYDDGSQDRRHADNRIRRRFPATAPAADDARHWNNSLRRRRTPVPPPQEPQRVVEAVG